MKSLTLSMIVKDEEKHLKECLESVKDVVDEIVIVDTGSTDATVEIAKSYCAKVYNFAWINDFSAARNYALSKSTGDWILYLDADERLDANSIQEVKQLTDVKQKIGYYCTVLSVDEENSRDNYIRYVRLFANYSNIKFSGKVHEQIEPSLLNEGLALIQSKILIKHVGYNVSAEEKKLKAKRNLFLLLEDYEANKSAYCAFQLGLTYSVLKDNENAINYFHVAAESGKLDRQYRAQCYTSLALIAQQNHRISDAEKYIQYSLKVDDKQPFAHMLASKIALRKDELVMAEERCKRAYLLNQEMQNKRLYYSLSIMLDSEEVIYYGLTLAIQNRNNFNYQFYQNELFSYFKKMGGQHELTKFNVINKLFSNSAFTQEEIDLLPKMTNGNNLSFVMLMLGNNPYKQHVLEIVEKIRARFSTSIDIEKLYAKTLDELGRVEEATLVLEKLTHKADDDPSILFYLISFYLKQGLDEKIRPIVLLLEKKFSHVADVMTRVRTLKRKLLMLTKVPL
ncbi:MAG: glycosyltransferase family 2 protein [Bacteroidota bacterium]